MIDDRDLVGADAGPVASEEAAAEVGALPPELLEILHAGPGGPVEDGDDIDFELDESGNLVQNTFESGAPSIVDDHVLAPESDL